MASCECLPKCPFFNDEMARMPVTSQLMKARYCDGPSADNTLCARHRVFASLGREHVPGDLYPSELERAVGMLLAS